MKSTHPGRYLVPFGIFVVLFVLTLSSIGANVIIWQASTQACHAVQMNDLYQQANLFANAEDAILDQYVLHVGSQSQAEFLRTAHQLSVVLQAVLSTGDAGDRAFVQAMREKQAHYLLLADQFVRLVTTQQITRARALSDQLIEPLANQMDGQIAVVANQDQQRASQSLAHLDSTERLVIAFITLVFAAGLLLLTALWKVMQGYQRHLDRAKQGELDRMEQMALTDPLTGLANHRTLMEQIEAQLLQSQSTQQSFAVVFVDLDHFKGINDTCGHRAGDVVLCEVGRRLKESVCQDEVVGRYGGEEFLLMLTNTDRWEAKQRAEHLRVVLAEEPCLLEDEGNPAAKTVIALSASIGVAVYQEHGTSRATLIEAADRAMYYAKQTGRNRVCLAGEEAELFPGTSNPLQKAAH